MKQKSFVQLEWEKLIYIANLAYMYCIRGGPILQLQSTREILPWTS